MNINPRIPKGEGHEPVRAYIEAMPEWRREIGERLEEVIERVVPDVQKAVKWNTPFYGLDDGFFTAFYCYPTYVQVTFFRGTSLDPEPPGASKVEGVRYWKIHEDDVFDEPLFSSWIEQASALPGEHL